MAVDASVSGSGSGLDLNSLLSSYLKGGDMSGLLGGSESGMGTGFFGGALASLLFRNGLNNNWDGNGTQNSDRAAIDAAVAAALASANQANNNSMLLLKDIQDSSQEVVSAINSSENALTSLVTSTSQTNLVQQLQNQIANLQGQGDIKNLITAGVGTLNNEIHEASQDLSMQLNTVNTNLLTGFNNVTREINADGEKTRALITANMVTELNNQIADLRTQRAVSDGGVNVTNNINQNSLMQQQQQQITGIANAVNSLLPYVQHIGQSVVNLGTMTGGAGQQTAANTRVN